MISARLSFVVALAAAVACGRAPATPAAPRRHVVLVTIDTLRADRLGRGIAPELDAFGATALTFTQARTTVPLTLPAHVSLLTGLLPPDHGVRLNGQILAADVPTLATTLKAAGYRTAAFVGAFVLDRRFGLGRGFDVYDDRVPRRADATDVLEASRRADAVVDAALQWLDQPSEAPFLLWVHLYDPHTPYTPPEPYRTRFAGRDYDGEVAFASAQAGRLLARLDARGLTASTVVVIAGDHGEGLGDHGESSHGMLAYDSTLRVPLMLRAPGLPPAAVPAPVSLADVAGSVLAASGVEGRLPGASEHHLQDADAGHEVYAETTYPAVAGWHPLYVLAGAAHKVVRSATLEYFDLLADPGESHDVSAAHAASARAAVARLTPLMTDRRAAAPASADAAPALRALGYASGGGATRRDDAPNPAAHTAAWTRFERATVDPATEVATLGALATAFPDGQVFVTSYARALAGHGRHAEALRLLRDAVTRFPGDASLFHDLAVAARAAGDPAEALRAAQAAVALDAHHAAAQHGLALALLDAGRDTEALQAFARATDADPSNATYWSDLGNARRAHDDLSGAGAAYDRALAIDAAHADAANGRGVLLVQAGRASEATAWFERALTTAPDLHEARLNLGIALQQAGRGPEAAATYREVLRRAPRSAVRERQAATTLLRGMR